MRATSGEQIELGAGGYRAVIATVGATLRVLEHDGRALVVPFDADELRPRFRGAVLAPWPNRVLDGAYAFAGVAEQLPLTEPNRMHALHGLVAWLDFAVVRSDPDAVLLRARIEAQQGYPHQLEVDVAYALTASGLRTTVTGRNVGGDAAPWGTGPHPYLLAGPLGEQVDGWTLDLPADEVIEIEGERLLPVGRVAVDSGDGRLDFRAPRRIDGTFIDHAFTGLRRDADGTARVRVTGADGRGAEVRFGPECPWVQVHTADLPQLPDQSRQSLAVEPMTCPPDAFNSGTDLVVLQPGDEHAASWTIAAV